MVNGASMETKQYICKVDRSEINQPNMFLEDSVTIYIYNGKSVFTNLTILKVIVDKARITYPKVKYTIYELKEIE